MFTLLEFAAKLGEIEHDMKEIGPAIVAKACEMVCAEAKRVLGTHDYDWPELKPETIANKMRGDTPLLETGKCAPPSAGGLRVSKVTSDLIATRRYGRTRYLQNPATLVSGGCRPAHGR